MKDEKLYTQFGSIRSNFLATPIFNFLTLGGSLARTGWGIFMRYVSKIQKFSNLSKTGSFVEIFQREFTKIINLVKKSWKIGVFGTFFQLKRVIALWIRLLEAQKWGSKWNIIVICHQSRLWKNLLGLGGEIWGSEHGILRNLRKFNWQKRHFKPFVLP